MRLRDMTKQELITALKVARSEVSRLRSLHEPRHDAYPCQRCGRRDGMDAVVENRLWNSIMNELDIKGSEGVGGLLCLWCIDALALEKGVSGKVQLHFPGWALVSNKYPRSLNKKRKE